jgi:hypothetical protein
MFNVISSYCKQQDSGIFCTTWWSVQSNCSPHSLKHDSLWLRFWSDILSIHKIESKREVWKKIYEILPLKQQCVSGLPHFLAESCQCFTIHILWKQNLCFNKILPVLKIRQIMYLTKCQNCCLYSMSSNQLYICAYDGRT